MPGNIHFNPRYFSVEYSEYKFPIKFEFGVESGTFLMYLSFTHERPNNNKKDMTSRYSKFEILHPPNQKEETEKLMKLLAKRVAQQKATDKSTEKNKSKIGKYIYFSIYPFKDMEFCIAITCEPLFKQQSNIDIGYSLPSAYEEPLTLIHLQTKHELIADTDENNDLGNDILKKNRISAMAIKEITTFNKKLFTKIHEKRMQAAPLKKQMLADHRMIDKVSLTENRLALRLARNISRMNRICEAWSKEMKKCEVKYWLTLIYVRKVLMSVRNKVLKRDQRVEGNFDELLRRMRFRKYAALIHDKVQNQLNLRNQMQLLPTTVEIAVKSFRLNLALTYKRALKPKVREVVGKAFASMMNAELLLTCFNGVVFHLNFKRFLEYKKERIEWYQTQWTRIQSNIVKFSKERDLTFHKPMEEDLLKKSNERFYQFQLKLLGSLFNRKYSKFIEQSVKHRRSENESDPYGIDLLKVRRWIDKEGYIPIIKKAEELTITFTGFDKLFESSTTARSKYWEKLGFASEHKKDQDNLQRLERDGKLIQFAKACEKLQAIYNKNKFIFKLNNAFMINLVICAYHLENDRELVVLLEKSFPQTTKRRRESAMSSLSGL